MEDEAASAWWGCGCLALVVVVCIVGATLQTRLAKTAALKHPPAVITFYFPDEVKAVPYGTEGGVQWRIKFMVAEQTGGRWVDCKGEGYVLDNQGGRWQRINVPGGTISLSKRVKGGGSETIDWGVSDPAKHLLCGGTAIFNWTFTDQAGHVVHREESRTKLVHEGCPGK